MYKKMNKTIFKLLVLFIALVLTGCTIGEKKTSIDFKNEYESLNGEKNSQGVNYRTLNISKSNPYVTVEAKDIVNYINNKDTFYVYFGYTSCPWCRSVIETSIESAKEEGIDKIYYVNIHDIRDTFSIDEDGNLVTTKEGSEEYYEILELMDNVLSDYSLLDEEGNKVDTNEKRIYAPNFVYVENGKPIKMVEGVSDLQTDSMQELTDEIKSDMKETFKEFFKES